MMFKVRFSLIDFQAFFTFVVISIIHMTALVAESGSFRPWVVSPGRFALVFGVGRFALIRWVVSPVSRFARESFRPGSFRPNIL